MLFGDQALAVLTPTRGHTGVMRVRELLANIESQNTDSNVIHAASQVLRRVRQRSLVVLMTDIDDASSEGQLVAALRLLRPRHLPFVAALSQLDPGAIADRVSFRRRPTASGSATHATPANLGGTTTQPTGSEATWPVA